MKPFDVEAFHALSVDEKRELLKTCALKISAFGWSIAAL